MKSSTPLLFALAAASLCAAPLERAVLLDHAVRGAEPAWAAAQDPAMSNPRTAGFFTAALAFCEDGRHPERLALLVERMAGSQDRDQASPHYGSFRWLWNDRLVTDQNAVEFCMQPAAVLWLRHRDSLAPAVREKFRAILEPAAVVASLRHRVSDGYTNIALMSASNLIMLGEGLGRADVADEGYKRLQAVFDVTLKSGIREYVSPDYYGVDLDALQLAAAFAQRPAGRRQAQALVELFWSDVAAHFWWPNLKLCGAHSRNYDYLHGVGGLDRHLWAAGWIEGGAADNAGAVLSAIARWNPPAALVEMSRAQLPRVVRQMWGGGTLASVTPGAPAAPATSEGKVWAAVTHWLGRDVTLSVGGKNYAVIDQALTIDFPGPRDSVRCYFIPDGRGDAYGKSKIPWRGHPKAVHLAPFFAAVQETQDALALVVYRDEDVPPECTSLESHLVMPRAVDALYVGEKKIVFTPGQPRTVPVAADTAVFLRQGTAALAVRVPAARTATGAVAPIALVWDDNEWGAIRLTVDHRLGSQPRQMAPAAALQVRVGSELSEVAFAEFRRAFGAARGQMEFAPEKISLQSPAAKSPLAIAASAPWAQPTRLDPAPPRVVLEIDGKDIGTPMLQAAR